LNTFYEKMTIYKLKDLLDSQYETKMNKVKPKTLTRQAEISKTCRSISHMNTDDLITDLFEFLTFLGNANAFQNLFFEKLL